MQVGTQSGETLTTNVVKSAGIVCGTIAKGGGRAFNLVDTGCAEYC